MTPMDALLADARRACLPLEPENDDMRESDLYAPVKRWLDAHGYVVYVEIFDCDIVAVKDGRLTAIELKLGHTEVLQRQLQDRARWADEVFCAVPVRPRYTTGYTYHGYGVLLVNEDKCRQIVKPRQQPWFREKQRKYRFKVLNHRAPAMDHEIAGLPSCRELRQQRVRRLEPIP